ncbi:hypothetical protein T492DRAFT_82627 [Pavlovales sp. CCMP2436]|nr:hypothetical protein T492DRAFT_82627 [Pavlovales sp. CCMP2436]
MLGAYGGVVGPPTHLPPPHTHTIPRTVYKFNCIDSTLILGAYGGGGGYDRNLPNLGIGGLSAEGHGEKAYSRQHPDGSRVQWVHRFAIRRVGDAAPPKAKVEGQDRRLRWCVFEHRRSLRPGISRPAQDTAGGVRSRSVRIPARARRANRWT